MCLVYGASSSPPLYLLFRWVRQHFMTPYILYEDISLVCLTSLHLYHLFPVTVALRLCIVKVDKVFILSDNHNFLPCFWIWISCETAVGSPELILYINNFISNFLSLSKVLCRGDFLDLIFQFFYWTFYF